jgi:hypothetical protein
MLRAGRGSASLAGWRLHNIHANCANSLGRTYRRRISRSHAQASAAIVYNSNDAGIGATGKADHTEKCKATKRISEVKSKKPHKPRPGTIESFSSRDMLYDFIAQMRKPLAILLAKVGANGPHTLPASLFLPKQQFATLLFSFAPVHFACKPANKKIFHLFYFHSVTHTCRKQRGWIPISNRKSQALLKEIRFMVLTVNLA